MTFEPTGSPHVSSTNSSMMYTNTQYGDYVYSGGFGRRHASLQEGGVNSIQNTGTTTAYYGQGYTSGPSSSDGGQPCNVLSYGCAGVHASPWLVNYQDNVMIPIESAVQSILPNRGSQSFGIVDGMEGSTDSRTLSSSVVNTGNGKTEAVGNDEQQRSAVRPLLLVPDVNGTYINARGELENDQQIGGESPYIDTTNNGRAHPSNMNSNRPMSSSSYNPSQSSTSIPCMPPSHTQSLLLSSQKNDQYAPALNSTRPYLKPSDSLKPSSISTPYSEDKCESPSESLLNGEEASYKDENYDKNQFCGLDDDEIHGYNSRKLNKRHWGTGRKKIEIKYIDKKLKRQITFSKRKSGMMKKIRELATLTGTQALLVLVSETGHFYSYATSKLRSLVTDERKNIIKQALEEYDIIGLNEQRPPGYNC
ncbi:uncharacterized protein LOC126316448 [Schistocerca gregaria]|uniref:uncharacterized protein LOC126316448 n=1 Tax=Schistocerca gregaria TaxID=7010 RepID=UPI00211EC46A|nr:uncharacterized protein LOC126316448 [Schistocerca gregaria]